MAQTHITQNLLRFSMLAFALMIFTIPSSALITPSPNALPAKTGSTVAAALSNMSVAEFLALTPKKYKEITGEKLSLNQKISLKIAQRKIRKALKNNDEIDSATVANAFVTSDFNIGGFVLGLILPAIGVLIAYLIDDPVIIKWAWVGFVVFLTIFLLWLII